MPIDRSLAALALLVVPLSARAADVDPHIPADTEVVITLNVQQVLVTPLGKQVMKPRIESVLKDRPQIQAALLVAGVDPLKDITRVTLAMSPSEADGGFLIVTGKFNRIRIAAIAERLSAEQKGQLRLHKSGDSIVYELVGDQPLFATFASDTTMLVSSERTRLTDASKRGQAKKELVALIETADARQSIWLAALPGATAIVPLLDEAQQLLLNQVQGVMGSIKVETRARVALTLVTQNANAAVSTGRTLIDLMEMVRTFAPTWRGTPGIGPIVDIVGSVRVRAQGKTVGVSAEVTAEQADRALTLLGELIK